MDIKRIMRIMDLSFHTRRTIERSLHEIDRRALNAMVLVKQHGNKLASYGVVAQAFREHAVHLKQVATPLQRSIAPLVCVQMRILQLGRMADMLDKTAGVIARNGGNAGFLHGSRRNWICNMETEEAEAAMSCPLRLVRVSESTRV
ncbi:MAG TPA: hypothetical protein VGL22_03350 [Terracidiphilus sp.]